MKITGEWKVNLKNNYVRKLGEIAAQDAILDLALDVQKQAALNVAPGLGPGPHPHRTPRIDTGRLMASVDVSVERTGNVVTVAVFTTVEYGTYLELGWHAANGRFYRYPWIMPALESAVPHWRLRAAAKMRQTLETRYHGLITNQRTLNSPRTLQLMRRQAKAAGMLG